MLQITDEKGTVIHEGEDHEMKIAYEYLTTAGWILAEKRGYMMRDLYALNAKYYNEATKNAKELKLKSL